MKLALMLILFTLSAAQAQVVDKPLAQSIKDQAALYKESRKSPQPDAAVVFISSSIDPTFMFIRELSIDSPDLSDNQIIINRPQEPFIQPITTCSSERGSVSFTATTITINSSVFPVRVRCFGNGENYREAYTTFKKP